MVSYLMEVKRLTHHFNRFSITRIPRAQNERADALARSASTRTPGSVPTTESVAAPTIATHEVAKTNLLLNWIEEILRYKVGGNEPNDPAIARRLRRAQAWYYIIGEKLYRRAFSQPLLCCRRPKLSSSSSTRGFVGSTSGDEP